MELPVINKEGKETGRKAKLADEFFAIEPNDHVMYLDVKNYRANQRQGTHKAKERGEIARTTKKFFRQKGTGNARVGSLRSPIQRGGGTVFGPRPHKYGFKLNKKTKALARKSALSMKAKDKNLVVLETPDFEKPSTKDFVKMLEAIGVNGKKSLLVLGDANKSLYLSSRNFKGANVITYSQLNTYEVMSAQSVVLAEDSLEKLETVLSK